MQLRDILWEIQIFLWVYLGREGTMDTFEKKHGHNFFLRFYLFLHVYILYMSNTFEKTQFFFLCFFQLIFLFICVTYWLSIYVNQISYFFVFFPLWARTGDLLCVVRRRARKLVKIESVLVRSQYTHWLGAMIYRANIP